MYYEFKVTDPGIKGNIYPRKRHIFISRIPESVTQKRNTTHSSELLRDRFVRMIPIRCICTQRSEVFQKKNFLQVKAV